MDKYTIDVQSTLLLRERSHICEILLDFPELTVGNRIKVLLGIEIF